MQSLRTQIGRSQQARQMVQPPGLVQRLQPRVGVDGQRAADGPQSVKAFTNIVNVGQAHETDFGRRVVLGVFDATAARSIPDADNV